MAVASGLDGLRNMLVPPPLRMIEHSFVFSRSQVSIGSSQLGLLLTDLAWRQPSFCLARRAPDQTALSIPLPLGGMRVCIAAEL